MNEYDRQSEQQYISPQNIYAQSLNKLKELEGISIHGKKYHTVAERVNVFRKQAVIRTPTGRTVASGLASEVVGSSSVNKTSALENCETSAIGRALAFFGFAGTEIASANEVEIAKEQQSNERIARNVAEGKIKK